MAEETKLTGETKQIHGRPTDAVHSGEGKEEEPQKEALRFEEQAMGKAVDEDRENKCPSSLGDIRNIFVLNKQINVGDEMGSAFHKTISAKKDAFLTKDFTSLKDSAYRDSIADKDQLPNVDNKDMTVSARMKKDNYMETLTIGNVFKNNNFVYSHSVNNKDRAPTETSSGQQHDNLATMKNDDIKRPFIPTPFSPVVLPPSRYVPTRLPSHHPFPSPPNSQAIISKPPTATALMTKPSQAITGTPPPPPLDVANMYWNSQLFHAYYPYPVPQLPPFCAFNRLSPPMATPIMSPVPPPPQTIFRPEPVKFNETADDRKERLTDRETKPMISTRNDAPRYQCNDCNKSYSTFSGLSKHRQFHCVSQSKKSFSCKYCEKVYVSLGALKMHIRTHTLPCKCKLCGKAFSRPWLLQGHIRTHTGEKPFSCTLCNRSFADRSNLRAHLQTHSDVKKYCCKCCGKTFSRMSLLVKHEDGGCPASLR